MKLKNFYKKYNIQIKLLFPLLLCLVIMTTFFYFLIPMVLNYPEGTYGTSFQTELENTNYFVQVLLIALGLFGIFVFLTFYKTWFLIKNRDLIEHPQKYSIEKINYIKNKLFLTPYQLFGLNICIPSISLTIIHSFTIGQFSITTLKIFLLVISLTTFFVTAVLIYNNSIFKKILLGLPYDKTNGIKSSTLRFHICVTIIPIIVASLIFIGILGYSKISIEKGNSLFYTYSSELSNFTEYNENLINRKELFQAAKNIKLLGDNDYFFLTKDGVDFYDINGTLIPESNFFKKYLNELSEKNDGRVYEYYGIDAQAATSKINIGNEEYIVGVYYKITSANVLLYFLLFILFTLFLNIVIFILFSSSISNDINVISDKFKNIATNQLIMNDSKLSLTSNDEIGELIISYNKIQELTLSNIEEIKNNQDTLMERERLASLGQLIGRNCTQLKNSYNVYIRCN